MAENPPTRPEEENEPEAAPPTRPPTTGPVPSPPSESSPPEDWSVRYKYLLADFENFRRRVEREREGISRQARAAMLRELLPLFEAFRSAQEALGHLPNGNPVRRGLELLDREWTTFFKREGVVPVAEVGRPFRADEAEAVGEAPSDARHPDGTVAEVVQQGYRFYGGLLRPAKVIVGRAPSPPSSTEPAPTEKSET